MAESHNIEIARDLDVDGTLKNMVKTIKEIDYETMESELRVFDNYDVDPTIDDLAMLLSYAKKFADSDAPSTIINKPDEDSCNGPDELKMGDSVIAPMEQKAEVVTQCDEALDVTPAKGTEIRNSCGILIGWLDPAKTATIRAPPRSRTKELVSAAWRGVTGAVRVLFCCSPK